MTMDIRETIRTKWFNNHVATLTDLGEVQILKWAEPGQWCYRMEYIMRDNKLIVTGDLGHAVFDLTWKATPGSFKGITNIHYFMEKLAGGQRSKWTFDEKLFEEDLNEWFSEVTEDYKEDDKEYQEYEEIKEVLEHVTSEYDDPDVLEYFIWFRLQDLDFRVESEDIQSFVNFGRKVSSVYYSYLVGLQMAHEQLEKAKSEKPVIINIPGVDTWTKTDLLYTCKKNKVKGYTRMDKPQLIEEVKKIMTGKGEKR